MPWPFGRTITLAFTLVSLVTAGSASAQLFGGGVDRSQVENRSVLTYMPDTLAPGAPLVVLLHGGSKNAEDMLSDDTPSGIWKRIADREGLFLAAPNGMGAYGDRPEALSAFWNDCDSADNSGTTGGGETDDRSFLTRLIGELTTVHDLDPDRVYLYGVSNGGRMVLRMAREAPEVFTAGTTILGLDPGVDICAQPAEPTPLLIIHGTDDPLAPYEGASPWFGRQRESAPGTYQNWVDRNDVNASPEHSIQVPNRSTEDSSTVSCVSRGSLDREVRFCTMDGAGHLDPSIDRPFGAFGQLVLGPQNRDIEGAEEAWTFFERVTP